MLKTSSYELVRCFYPIQLSEPVEEKRPTKCIVEMKKLLLHEGNTFTSYP